MVLSQDKVLQRFMEQIIHDDKVGEQDLADVLGPDASV